MSEGKARGRSFMSLATPENIRAAREWEQALDRMYKRSNDLKAPSSEISPADAQEQP